MLQECYCFGLFQKDGKQGGLERQERIGLADGGNMQSCGGEKAVENVLVMFSQSSPKARERRFCFVEELRDGDKCASHNILEQDQLFFFYLERVYRCKYFICLYAQIVHQERLSAYRGWCQANNNGGDKAQTVDFFQAGIQ